MPSLLLQLCKPTLPQVDATQFRSALPPAPGPLQGATLPHRNRRKGRARVLAWNRQE